VTGRLTLDVPPELLDAISERVAAILAERQAPVNEDGWLRGAEQIAAYIGAPRSRVYALTSSGRIPVHHDGAALIARRSELDAWLRDGGGRRP
jgi:excisionase family DNA binding protein